MNRESGFGTESSPDRPARQTMDFGGGDRPPAKKHGREPAADASGMDALVSEFLEELDTVSAALTTVHKPAAAPRTGFTHKSETAGSGRNIRKSSGPRTGLAFEFELNEDEDSCEDVDAELEQTLLDLEGRSRSNVLPLIIREPDTSQSQGAAVPEISVALESLLLAPSVEAPAPLDAAHPARPEIRFIPAASADEQPESGAWVKNRVAHIRTVLRTLPRTLRRFIPTASADEQPESGTWVKNRIARIRTLMKTLLLTLRRFIPAASADEQPESGAWAINRIAHIQTRLKTLPPTGRKIAIGIAAMAVIVVVLLAYQYYSARRASVGTTSQVGSPAPGTVAQAASKTGSQNVPAAPAIPDGRRWVERSATARIKSSQPRDNSSRSIPAADPLGSGRADMARAAENAAHSGAGRGEPPMGVTAGSGADAVQPPVPGTAGARGTEALPTTTVETPPPATPPAAQISAQQPNATKPISEAPPAGLTQIPAAPRTAAFATAPPPGKLTNLEPRADSSLAKLNPATLASPAVPLNRVSPQYPATARRIQEKGKVELTVEVDEQGNVTRAKAISGPLVLRPAAEEALMQWRFKPATLRGANIKSEVTISVEFKQ
jgi:TonB family protein